MPVIELSKLGLVMLGVAGVVVWRNACESDVPREVETAVAALTPSPSEITYLSLGEDFAKHHPLQLEGPYRLALEPVEKPFVLKLEIDWQPSILLSSPDDRLAAILAF